MELQIYRIFLAWLVTSARESSRYSQSLLGFFQRKALAFLGAHKWERQRGEEGCDYRFLYLRWGPARRLNKFDANDLYPAHDVAQDHARAGVGTSDNMYIQPANADGWYSERRDNDSERLHIHYVD